MRFEFSTSGKIIFGEGTVVEAVTAVQALGERALLICGAGKTAPNQLMELLNGSGVSTELFSVEREPTPEMVSEGLNLIRANRIQVVVALGGGSSIDTAKAAAVLAGNPGDPVDYLEVVGKSFPLQSPGLPMIAIPTTSGTGSEVTRNAVLYVKEKRMKVSLRSPFMIPKVAIVDPELTYSVPPNVTASTGMDALAQVLEPFVSSRSNPLVDALCCDGMERAGRSLHDAYQDGSNRRARNDMSFASLLGGLALANAGLGAVHGFASPIGGMYDASHGTICARLLAPVVRVNVKALEQRASAQPALGKYQKAARLITGSARAGAADLPIWVEALCDEMHIPKLRDIGVQENELEEIARKAASASSMQANPIKLEMAELLEILAQAL